MNQLLTQTLGILNSIGYVQYEKRSSIPSALGLNGTKFKKHTITVQATMAEKNNTAASYVLPLLSPSLAP